MTAFTSYLDLDGFRSESIMPAAEISRLESAQPGWIASRLARWSSYINDRARKRYAVPFAEPYPATAIRWLVDLTTFDCYRKLGFDPSTDDDKAAIIDPRNIALDEIKEAADSKDGLFDLPLADGSSAISAGGPLSYSETSPYVWADIQACNGRPEDRRGR